MSSAGGGEAEVIPCWGPADAQEGWGHVWRARVHVQLILGASLSVVQGGFLQVLFAALPRIHDVQAPPPNPKCNQE